MAELRCTSCFRTERHTLRDDTVVDRVVLEPGGQRQPAVDPSLAAFRALHKAHQGGLGAAVAPCPACGQPMVLTAGTLPAQERWELPVPDGVLVVDGDSVRLPTGSSDWEAASEWIEAALRPTFEVRPAEWAMSLVTLSLFSAVLLLWLAGMVWIAGYSYSRMVAPPAPVSGGGW